VDQSVLDVAGQEVALVRIQGMQEDPEVVQWVLWDPDGVEDFVVEEGDYFYFTGCC
jgi:hypothetical protein